MLFGPTLGNAPVGQEVGRVAANASGPAICRNNSRAALKGSSCSSRAHTNSRQVTSRILASRMNSCTNAVFPHPAGPSSRTTWPRPSDDSLKRPRRMLDCRSRSNNCINFAFLMTPRSPTAPPPVTSLPLFERQGIPGNTSHIVATAVRGNLRRDLVLARISYGRTEFGEVPRRTGSQPVRHCVAARSSMKRPGRCQAAERVERVTTFDTRWSFDIVGAGIAPCSRSAALCSGRQRMSPDSTASAGSCMNTGRTPGPPIRRQRRVSLGARYGPTTVTQWVIRVESTYSRAEPPENRIQLDPTMGTSFRHCLSMVRVNSPAGTVVRPACGAPRAAFRPYLGVY